MRLAIVASHPVQYHAPIYRELSRHLQLKVFFSHRASPTDQAHAGYLTPFSWDVDILSGYEFEYLDNASNAPGLSTFSGCDTPGVGKELREFRADVLLTSGWHYKSYIQAILAARQARIPVITRGDSQIESPRSPLKRALKAVTYPLFLRAFSAGLYVGKRSRQYWRHYNFPEQRLFFSPHCVDNSRFQADSTLEHGNKLRHSLGIRPDRTVVLFAGRLVPFKRPLDLVTAVARLRTNNPNIHLMIAGSGPLENDVIMASQEAGIEFSFLGFCNQSKMPSVYAAADILVLSSDASETWGLVANEALASGCPIIVSDTCGCAEDLAIDEIAGLSYPVGNCSALADAIARMMTAPPDSRLIAEKSSQYSVEAACEGILAACRSVIEQR